MNDVETIPEQLRASRGRGRRLTIIVGVAVLVAMTLAFTTIYAERKVNDESRRVQRMASSVNINAQDILDAAYTSSDKIAAAFGVSGDRVSITISDADVACIAVRSEYITSSRSSAFLVGHDGSLTPTDHC